MPQNYRHHKSLKHEIEKIVEEEFKSNIELKNWAFKDDKTITCEATITAGKGYMEDLSFIAKTTTTTPLAWNRENDVIHAKTLRLRAYIQGQAPSAVQSTWRDGCSVMRIIIFTYLPYEANTVIKATDFAGLLDLAQDSTNGWQICAPHVMQGKEAQYVVHHDETISISPAGGGFFWNSDPEERYQVTYPFRKHCPPRSLSYLPVVASNVPQRLAH